MGFASTQEQQSYWHQRAAEQGETTVGHTLCNKVSHDKITSEWRCFLRPYIDTYTSHNPTNPILDFGCGVGRFTSLLRNPIGVDPTLHLLEIARQKHPQVQFMHMDDPPKIPLDKADGILCVTVLQHLTAPLLFERTVLEFARVLTRNSHIILLENTSNFPDKEHIHFRKKEDYRSVFRDHKILLFPMDSVLDAHGEQHTLFVGVKR